MLIRAGVIAAMLACAASPAIAQSVREQAEARLKEITANLQSHSATAKAEGAKGGAAMQAGDKAAACTSFKTSRAETATVLDLLQQQREQILIATPDTATALGRANQNDAMQGTWLGLASQLDQRIAATCTN